MPNMPERLAARPVDLERCRVERVDSLMSAVQRSQPELARWLPWADPIPTIDAERDFINSQERAFDSDEDYGYSLIERPTGELVGGAGLHPRGAGIAEIGYWVRSDRTGRGYATAAAGALAAAALEYLADVQRVLIRMDQANVASAAVPPKLGYTLLGEETLRDVVTSGHPGKGWIWADARPT